MPVRGPLVLFFLWIISNGCCVTHCEGLGGGVSSHLSLFGCFDMTQQYMSHDHERESQSIRTETNHHSSLYVSSSSAKFNSNLWTWVLVLGGFLMFVG